MAFRSVKEFLALGGTLAPTPAERRVIAAVRAGERCVLGDKRPVFSTPDNLVRATLLRLLISRGTPECGLQDLGVWVEGAMVSGLLDLRFLSARGATRLGCCSFEQGPVLIQAKFRSLSFSSSQLAGLVADRIHIDGNFHLANLRSTGTIHLSGASIGGQLSCDGAHLDGGGGEALIAQGVTTGESMDFRRVRCIGTLDINGARSLGSLNCEGAVLSGAGGRALFAQGLEVRGNVNLRNARSIGPVDLNGAIFGGQIDCDSAALDGCGDTALYAQAIQVKSNFFLRRLKAVGPIDIIGSRIGGSMDCTGLSVIGANQLAFVAQRMRVSEGFLWREVTVKSGAVALPWAHVGDLLDDGRWPLNKNSLALDGFTYEKIGGNRAPVTAAGRRAWLQAGSVWEEKFRPQPYTQLARVLRSMGLGGEARMVLFWREQEVFKQAQKDFLGEPVSIKDMTFGRLGREVTVAAWKIADSVFRLVAGYGFYPWRAFWCLFGLFLVTWALTALVWHEGSFAPNSAVVLVSPEWQGLLAQDCVGEPPPMPCVKNPADVWSGKGQPGMDWDSFSSWGYALDLVVPVVNLGQTDAWVYRPSENLLMLQWRR